MLAGMTATDIVTLCAKVLSERGLHRCDDVTALAVSFKGFLFRKNRANCDELARATLRFMAATLNMTKQHICACLRP